MTQQTERVKPTASLFDLTGKVALVTGATGRLGREICLALAEMGAGVTMVARRPEPLEALKEELQDNSQTSMLTIASSALHEGEVEAIFQTTQKHFGKLDILVNCATGNSPDRVEQMSEITWDKVIHDIVGGMFLCCQAGGKLMARQGKGSIINISSIYGMVAADQRIYGDSGLNSSVVYGAGKGAVNQLTRYLASYWAENGIRVNTITPGGVEDEGNNHPEFRANYTTRTPMQRMMRREEIRGPIIYLASEASSYVTGQNLIVDGGFTIV